MRAASFAYHAFVAIFPLLLLFVSMVSLLPYKETSPEAIITWLKDFKPLSESSLSIGAQSAIVDTIEAVLNSRKQAGIVALILLAYSGQQIFQILVRGVNAAWGFAQSPWWHLPLKNLFMIVIVAAPLVFGIVLPVILTAVQKVLLAVTEMTHFSVNVSPILDLLTRVNTLLAPTLLLGYALYMIYKLAPSEPVYFKNIWLSTAVVTILLQVFQFGFFWFVENFGRYNAVYGTLSAIVVLLLWLFMSGNLIILGASLCAAHAEMFGSPVQPGKY